MFHPPGVEGSRHVSMIAKKKKNSFFSRPIKHTFYVDITSYGAISQPGVALLSQHLKRVSFYLKHLITYFMCL